MGGREAAASHFRLIESSALVLHCVSPRQMLHHRETGCIEVVNLLLLLATAVPSTSAALALPLTVRPRPFHPRQPGPVRGPQRGAMFPRKPCSISIAPPPLPPPGGAMCTCGMGL